LSQPSYAAHGIAVGAERQLTPAAFLSRLLRSKTKGTVYMCENPQPPHIGGPPQTCDTYVCA